MDIGAIKARIAELEQRKAERNALRGYRDLAYLDYMTKGDRSGFDKIEADEVAYRNMLKQQEFNARENELNRQNALTLASMNKANELESKKDEYIRSRNKAASILDYAQQALAQDPNNIQLQKELQLAKEDFDFYDRKLGGQGYDNIAVETKEPSDGLNNNQVNSIVKSIVDKKTYTDDDRNKLRVLSEYVNDQTIKEQINTILSNKGLTKEDKDTIKATREEFAKNWKPGQTFDTKIYKQKFKNGKPYLVVK